ncbi:MAG: ABC transporter ATP-binding protein [Patescibacteria group bacterium]
MNKVLEVKNLTKKYDRFTAVDDISFFVNEGEAVGFLGPNGAGKTTTIQILLGITSPTAGTIKFFGKDFSRHKKESLQRINFASAFNTLQGRISVWENLLVYAHLYRVKNPKEKIMEFINYFEGEALLKQRYWDLSAGQKTKINLIKSLINDPEIILMDEPTASLDPDVVDKTLSFIEELKKSRKITLLYTSHNMDEITRVCDKIIFLDHGKIVAQDTPLNLTKQIKTSTLKLTFDGKEEEMEKYLKSQKLKYEFLNKYTVKIAIEEKLIPSVIFGISKTALWITDIEVQKPTLEDFFLHIVRGKNYVNSKN